MFITAFDIITDKIVYLIQNNEGKLTDLNGIPFNVISDNKVKDINGRLYIFNKTLTPTTTTTTSTTTQDLLFNVHGVEWDINNATVELTRVGNLDLHKADTGLPVQNAMKRCLLLDNGSVNYYLDPTDSTKKLDGSPSILDGTDGQVMVEIPQHYRKFETVGDTQRVLISEYPFEGSHLVPLQYISAFEAALQRSTNKLSSVINFTTDYRGGNNTSAWDVDNRSLLGKPVTSLSRIGFTTAAQTRGLKWFQMLYETYKTVVWLYMIEYANRNSQAAFNPTLTSEGYRQGGLGEGVTNIVDASWDTFNSFNPFVNCGQGSMNNFNSSTPIVHPTLGTTQIPQYRGIEHPFGHIWKWAEGINVRALPSAIEMYTANGYTFSSTTYNDYTLQGNLAIATDYIRNLLQGNISNQVEIMPTTVGSGASATTFWTDQYFQTRPVSGESLRAVDFGGGADSGATAGLLLSTVFDVPSASNSVVGGRLCFIPSA
jgi:hypothetical protein